MDLAVSFEASLAAPRVARVAAAIAALSLLLSAPAASQEPAPEDTTVREQIVVSETSLVVDFGAALTGKQIRKLLPGGVIVIEENEQREVLRASPVLATREDAWELVLYFDAALSRPETLADAATALGAVAQDLTFLGSVRVLLADPAPRELLRSRSAVKLQDVLAQLAQSRPGMDLLTQMRDRFAERVGRGEALDETARLAAVRQEDELVRTQSDHLLRLAGDGCPASACALFLASDGFHLSPEAYYLGEAWAKAQADSHRPSAATAIAYELAETLSAMEWVTTIMALRPPPASEAKPVAPPGSDFDRYAQDRGTYFDGITLRRRRSSSVADLPLGRWDVYLLPILQPLRMVAAETSGAVLRDQSQLASALQSLYRRHRVWYRTPRPLDGKVRPVEARLSNGRQIDSPLWVDSSTPEGVAGARTRGLLSGASGRGELLVSARRESANRETLDVEIGWAKGSRPLQAGAETSLRVRVSLAYEGEEGPEVRHAILELATRDAEKKEGESQSESDGERHAFKVPLAAAAASAQIAVVVEDLRSRVWGGTLSQ